MSEFSEGRRNFTRALVCGAAGGLLAYVLRNMGGGEGGSGEDDNPATRIENTHDLVGIPEHAYKVGIKEERFYTRGERGIGEKGKVKEDKMNLELQEMVPEGHVEANVAQLCVQGEFRGRRIVGAECKFTYFDGKNIEMVVPDEKVGEWYDQKTKQGKFFVVPKALRVREGAINVRKDEDPFVNMDGGTVRITTVGRNGDEMVTNINWRRDAKG